MSKVVSAQKRVGELILVILLSGIMHSVFAQKADTVKVLFVGNSYTYFWNLPQTVSAMLSTEDRVFYIRQSTAGGASLEDHWNGEKELTSQDKISSTNWDYIVLQNHSMSTLDSPDSFKEYGEKMANLAKKTGAQLVWYMTWSRKANPLMIHDISEGYEKIALTTQSDIVPVGKIWEHIITLRPEMELYDPDGSHPSPLGTYITACAFYKYLTGKPLGDLPQRIIDTDKNGEKLYLNIQPQPDAQFVQAAIEDFYSKGSK